MQNKDYKNFAEEKSEEIAVGVPINMPQGRNFIPYFHQNAQLPYQTIPPQNHFPHQNASFNQMVQQQRLNQPQMMIRQPQTQVYDYSKPINIRCPCCSMAVTTVMNNEAGNAAYLWAGIIFCCISPFCTCLPFMTDKCMDKNHYCPHCGFNILRKHKGLCECP